MRKVQIEILIDRICGMYATTSVPRNSMKEAWISDEYLQDFDEQVDRRKLLSMVENHNKVPSLPEFKRMLRTLEPPLAVLLNQCKKCAGSGWWDGLKVANALFIDGTWVPGEVLQERFEEDANDRTYQVSRRCPDCQGAGVA